MECNSTFRVLRGEAQVLCLNPTPPGVSGGRGGHSRLRLKSRLRALMSLGDNCMMSLDTQLFVKLKKACINWYVERKHFVHNTNIPQTLS